MPKLGKFYFNHQLVFPTMNRVYIDDDLKLFLTVTGHFACIDPLHTPGNAVAITETYSANYDRT